MQGLPLGRLLGTVKLEALRVYTDEGSFYADSARHLCFEKHFAYVKYGFVLRVIEKFDNPPPLKGALGFFERSVLKGVVE